VCLEYGSLAENISENKFLANANRVSNTTGELDNIRFLYLVFLVDDNLLTMEE
jgi:hypothetical protein